MEILRPRQLKGPRGGQVLDREYAIWYNMVTRCTDPRHPSWQWYGAMGIKVCKRWELSFKAWLEDMGPRPSKSHSLDRANGKGNYEPDNCRWATRETQSRNRPNRAMITYEGKTMCISAWAEALGMKVHCLWHRLNT